MQPPQDIMAARALQQMRDTVTPQPTPIVIPSGQPSVATAQPDTAPQPQPKEEKPAAVKEPTTPQEPDDPTNTPLDNPAVTDSTDIPTQTDLEQTEPKKQRRQNRQARRNRQEVPNAEEPTIAPASATEQTSVPLPSQQTTGATETTQAAQAALPTGTENPWMEAALSRLAGQQIYRLFGRGDRPMATPSLNPAGNQQPFTIEAVPSFAAYAETNQPWLGMAQSKAGATDPWVESALYRPTPQTPPENTSGNTPAPQPNPVAQGPHAEAAQVPNAESTAQSAGETRTVRETRSGYGDVQPYVDRMDRERQDTDALLQKVKQTDAKIDRANDEYKNASQNPLAEIVLEKQKPESDEKKKKRLKTAAILIALNDIFAAIGQGIGGFSVKPTDSAPLTYLRNQLQQLDDIYRNDKRRYDQNELLAAMRKDKAVQEAAKQKIDTETNRRKHYADRYDKAVEGNRDIAKKRAELEVKASEFSNEQAYKQEALQETRRHNRANESLQSRRIEKEHPEVSVLNYKTGKAELLDKEKWARLGGYIARILDQRESTKKGPYGEWIAGKSPLPLNSRITDEELKELQKAATNGEKLTANQLGVITRLFNEMENGEVYETENSTPFYMPDKPQSMYAQSIRPQYENWLQGMREYYTLTGQMPDNTITVDEARQLFDGMQNVPDKEITDVLQAAGWQVTE